MSQDRDEFDDLEAMLRQLPLLQPSAGLDARIRRAARGGPPTRRVLGVIGASLAAAAGVLFAFWLVQRPAVSPIIASAAPATQRSTEIVNKTEQWLDEGIVGYSSDGPVRQYRFQSIEQRASANESNARTLYVERVEQVVSEAY